MELNSKDVFFKGKIIKMGENRKIIHIPKEEFNRFPKGKRVIVILEG